MPTPPENYAVMAEFINHITKLTPIVLSAQTIESVKDDTNIAGRRVDTLVRQDKEGNIWIFAVRLTEVDEADSMAIDVTFTVDGLTQEILVIEPGEFSQSVEESYGNPTEKQRIIEFTLKNIPVIPGTVQVAGQYSKGENCGRIHLYDDGKGRLYGNPVSWMYKNMLGIIDYKTGKVYVDFGDLCIDSSTPTWTNKPILPGLDAAGKKNVRVTYRPVKNDRIISHTENTFRDTFAPNAVHIYGIAVSSSTVTVPTDVNIPAPTYHHPVFDPIGNKIVSASSPLTFTVNATDPDGDAIIYWATDLPQGATFDHVTRTFTWTPTKDQIGNHTATFKVRDNTLITAETITITVTNVIGHYPPIN